MADASDDVLKILDTIVKKQKNKSRLKTIDVWKDIDKILIKAEKNGFKNFSFMFEKFDDGTPTGNYISETN